jgi:AraC family transcriptional regulator of adaptative response/methylated-DNA-[protein]-cysteine methyltransferase
VNASLRAVYPQATPRQARANERPHQVLAALVAYLEGRGRCPTVEIDLRGSEFQCAVWRMLRRTKPGRILSYTELAQSLERPTAVRAVASACAANHIALLVPCHRVVRADGHLGGYRWGLTLKQHLLKHEQRR